MTKRERPHKSKMKQMDIGPGDYRTIEFVGKEGPKYTISKGDKMVPALVKPNKSMNNPSPDFYRPNIDLTTLQFPAYSSFIKKESVILKDLDIRVIKRKRR